MTILTECEIGELQELDCAWAIDRVTEAEQKGYEDGRNYSLSREAQLVAEIESLKNWRADVTAALQNPGGARFEDVPRLIGELRADNLRLSHEGLLVEKQSAEAERDYFKSEVENLRKQLSAQQIRDFVESGGLPEAQEARQAFERRRLSVEAALAGKVICDRCGATLETYANACTAELSERCPGFEAIENAIPKQKEVDAILAEMEAHAAEHENCDGLCIVRGWLEKRLERARYVGD